MDAIETMYAEDVEFDDRQAGLRTAIRGRETWSVSSARSSEPWRTESSCSQWAEEHRWTGELAFDNALIYLFGNDGRLVRLELFIAERYDDAGARFEELTS